MFNHRRREALLLEYLAQNPLYIVMFVVLVIWLGIYMYLFRIESRIKKLEKSSEK